MSNETPTMPDTAFNLAINFIKIDVCIRLLSELVPCDAIKKDELEDTMLYLRTLHKEVSDDFDVLKENEIEEEKMGGNMQDEEADVQQEKPLNFEGIH